MGKVNDLKSSVETEKITEAFSQKLFGKMIFDSIGVKKFTDLEVEVSLTAVSLEVSGKFKWFNGISYLLTVECLMFRTISGTALLFELEKDGSISREVDARTFRALSDVRQFLMANKKKK